MSSATNNQSGSTGEGRDRKRQTSSLISLALIGLALVYALVILWIFPKWTVDDAYITYRYAENLADHGELAWNVGEKPVEGYTGLLLPLALAAGIKTGVAPDLLSKTIGVMSFLLGAWLLFQISRALRIRDQITAVLLVLFLTLPIQFRHVFGGLETSLFIVMLLAGILLLLQSLASKPDCHKYDTRLMLVLLALSLTRPEGLAFSGIAISVLILCRMFDQRKMPWPLLSRVVVIYLLPILIHFGWRWWYYESFLPNTYYAKLLVSEGSRTITDSAVGFWRRYLAMPMAASVLLVPGYLARLRKDPQLQAKRHLETIGALTAIVMFLTVVMFQYSRSAPIMNYSYRFLAPLYPLFVIVLAKLADRGYAYLQGSAGRLLKVRIAVSILALGAIGVQVYRNGRFLKTEIESSREYMTLIQDEHIRVGQFLRENVPSNEWAVVHIDAGAIPYFSRLRTIDYGGLSDAYLARNQLSLEEEVDYFYSRNPGALVFTSHAADSVAHGDQAAAIVADPRFSRYSLTATFSSATMPEYHQLVFLRDGVRKAPDQRD